MDIYGEKMVYCSNCGAKIDDEAYFCPKCGTKTEKGKAAKALYPADELRDAFYQVGIELERAFNMAARETHSAIQRARENLQQKPPRQQTVTCSKCTTQNPNSSVFCYSCGTRLRPAEESHGSGV
ncbi:MAG: zinc-ribbon domain-containing protein [Candidatus Bathyarchaeia archaeon]|jgi:ribosomal protein L40E